MKNTKNILLFLIIGQLFLYYYYNIPIFYFKSFIIIILFSLNIFFLLNEKNTHQEEALISGFPGISLIKRNSQTITTLISFYATYLAVKSDNRANKEQVLEDLLKQCKQGEEDHKSMILKLRGQNTQLSAQTGRAVEHVENFNFHYSKMRERFKELSAIRQKDKLSEAEAIRIKELENLVNKDLGNLTQSNNAFLKDNPNYLDQKPENNLEESKTSPNSEDNEISKSFFFSGIFEKFESLDTYSKLAISLLLSKAALVSSLVSIAFVFYGDYLIKRFNLETRFPKIYEIINLRQKFNRYYLILNITTIVIIISAEVIFSIAILNL